MKKVLVILAIFVSTNAFAGILLEPYLGYASGKVTQSGQTDIKVTGMGYGARLGYALPLIFIAADYSMQKTSAKQGSNPSIDADVSDIGLVVGANLPIIRLWAGYDFKSKVDMGSNGYMTGKGMKVGVGYKLPAIPVSFNFEYIMDNYDKNISGGVTTATDKDAKVMFLSVSAPLMF
jgi:hypothetical protein